MALEIIMLLAIGALVVAATPSNLPLRATVAAVLGATAVLVFPDAFPETYELAKEINASFSSDSGGG